MLDGARCLGVAGSVSEAEADAREQRVEGRALEHEVARDHAGAPLAALVAVVFQVEPLAEVLQCPSQRHLEGLLRELSCGVPCGAGGCSRRGVVQRCSGSCVVKRARDARDCARDRRDCADHTHFRPRSRCAPCWHARRCAMLAATQHAKIHHVVHQIQWENAEAPTTPSWCSIASWRRFAAKHNWRHRQWTRAELEQQFDPKVWWWLSNQKVRGLHSLIASYQILHRHGGLVIDTSLIWLGAMISRDRLHPPTSHLLHLVSQHAAVVLPPLPIDYNDIAFVLESSLLAAPPGHAGLGGVLNEVREFALNMSQAPWRKRKVMELSQAQLALAAIRGTQTTPNVGRLPSSALIYTLAQSSSGGSHMATPSLVRTVGGEDPTMSNVTMRHLAWVQPPEWIQGGVPWRYGAASGINIRAQPRDPSGVNQCMRGAKGWVLFHPPGPSGPSAAGKIAWRKNASYTMAWPGKEAYLKKLSATGKHGLVKRFSSPISLTHDPKHDTREDVARNARDEVKAARAEAEEARRVAAAAATRATAAVQAAEVAEAGTKPS